MCVCVYIYVSSQANILKLAQIHVVRDCYNHKKSSVRKCKGSASV